MLISKHASSLVVDMLCDEAKEENVAVACFYVDFAAREEWTLTNMLGSSAVHAPGGATSPSRLESLAICNFWLPRMIMAVCT